MRVAPDSTDVTTYFDLGTTGLDVTTFDLQYTRSGAEPSAKVDATALAATDSAHADNKAIEIDATTSPGLYRVDWPDDAFATGVREVILSVVCGVLCEKLRVELRTDEVTAAGVADAVWDEAAAGHTDAGKAGAQMWTDVDAILADTGTDGVVVAPASKTGYALAAAGLDSVDTTEPANYASMNFAERLDFVFRHLTQKKTLTATQKILKKADGTTTALTWPVSDDDTTETENAAT